MTLPFRLATTRTIGTKTHLVLHSPRVPGLAPHQLHTTTLCCRQAHVPSDNQNLGDVECRLCLYLAPKYLTWPPFSTQPAPRSEQS